MSSTSVSDHESRSDFGCADSVASMQEEKHPPAQPPGPAPPPVKRPGSDPPPVERPRPDPPPAEPPRDPPAPFEPPREEQPLSAAAQP